MMAKKVMSDAKAVTRDARAKAIAKSAQKKVNGKTYWQDSIRKAQKRSVEKAKERVRKRGGVFMQGFSVRKSVVAEFRTLSLMEKRKVMSDAIRHIVR